MLLFHRFQLETYMVFLNLIPPQKNTMLLEETVATVTNAYLLRVGITPKHTGGASTQLQRDAGSAVQKFLMNAAQMQVRQLDGDHRAILATMDARVRDSIGSLHLQVSSSLEEVTKQVSQLREEVANICAFKPEEKVSSVIDQIAELSGNVNDTSQYASRLEQELSANKKQVELVSSKLDAITQNTLSYAQFQSSHEDNFKKLAENVSETLKKLQQERAESVSNCDKRVTTVENRLMQELTRLTLDLEGLKRDSCTKNDVWQLQAKQTSNETLLARHTSDIEAIKRDSAPVSAIHEVELKVDNTRTIQERLEKFVREAMASKADKVPTNTEPVEAQISNRLEEVNGSVSKVMQGLESLKSRFSQLEQDTTEANQQTLLQFEEMKTSQKKMDKKTLDLNRHEVVSFMTEIASAKSEIEQLREALDSATNLLSRVGNSPKGTPEIARIQNTLSSQEEVVTALASYQVMFPMKLMKEKPNVQQNRSIAQIRSSGKGDASAKAGGVSMEEFSSFSIQLEALKSKESTDYKELKQVLSKLDERVTVLEEKSRAPDVGIRRNTEELGGERTPSSALQPGFSSKKASSTVSSMRRTTESVDKSPPESNRDAEDRIASAKGNEQKKLSLTDDKPRVTDGLVPKSKKEKETEQQEPSIPQPQREKTPLAPTLTTVAQASLELSNLPKEASTEPRIDANKGGSSSETGPDKAANNPEHSDKAIPTSDNIAKLAMNLLGSGGKDTKNRLGVTSAEGSSSAKAANAHVSNTPKTALNVLPSISSPGRPHHAHGSAGHSANTSTSKSRSNRASAGHSTHTDAAHSAHNLPTTVTTAKPPPDMSGSGENSIPMVLGKSILGNVSGSSRQSQQRSDTARLGKPSLQSGRANPGLTDAHSSVGSAGSGVGSSLQIAVNFSNKESSSLHRKRRDLPANLKSSQPSTAKPKQRRPPKQNTPTLPSNSTMKLAPLIHKSDTLSPLFPTTKTKTKATSDVSDSNMGLSEYDSDNVNALLAATGSGDPGLFGDSGDNFIGGGLSMTGDQQARSMSHSRSRSQSHSHSGAGSLSGVANAEAGLSLSGLGHGDGDGEGDGEGAGDGGGDASGGGGSHNPGGGDLGFDGSFSRSGEDNNKGNFSGEEGEGEGEVDGDGGGDGDGLGLGSYTVSQSHTHTSMGGGMGDEFHDDGGGDHGNQQRSYSDWDENGLRESKYVLNPDARSSGSVRNLEQIKKKNHNLLLPCGGVEADVLNEEKNRLLSRRHVNEAILQRHTGSLLAWVSMRKRMVYISFVPTCLKDVHTVSLVPGGLCL
ncbi:hypothetical protein Pelo_16307 [Pelomyxa schiedti]|nr:hypothetical protein Pelo_16307 [Pelomyxa schiedti]